MKNQKYGYAARELFVQFMARIAKEMPTATLAMFSKLKYVNAPNFELFRENWSAKYLGGFIVDSKTFRGPQRQFPDRVLDLENRKCRRPEDCDRRNRMRCFG